MNRVSETQLQVGENSNSLVWFGRSAANPSPTGTALTMLTTASLKEQGQCASDVTVTVRLSLSVTHS